MSDIPTCKTLDSSRLTDDQMSKINRFTRRELSPEEVFCFSLILCDNEIDRDGECFPAASLEVLAELFIGKTGVFDHNPKAENQSARIFDAAVEMPGGTNALGEKACRLRAWAYMLRSEKNEALIAEIDGGIKKEVSVGCSVARVTCSVCGADQKTAPCSHQKGRTYDGVPCCHLLEEPTDAYEWSFVAVPAQKNAGVTKRAFSHGESPPATSLEKLFSSNGEVLLSPGELRLLEGQFKALSSQAKAGEHYLSGLRGEVVKLAGVSELGLSPALVERIAAGLDAEALTELRTSLARLATKGFPIGPQLAPAEDKAHTATGEYNI